MRKKVSFLKDFFTVPNKVNSYWAGFLAADGYVSKSKNCVEVHISTTDLEHLKKFTECAEFDGKISIQTSKDGKESCKARFYSTQWCEDLNNNFNVTPQKTFTFKFPENLSDELQKCFLIGYIDGDGSIYNQKGSNYLTLSVIGTENIARNTKRIINEIMGDVKQFNNKIEKDRSIYRYRVSGKIVQNVLLPKLKKIEVPKLERKWNKVQ